jgi:hypothetical protein
MKLNTLIVFCGGIVIFAACSNPQPTPAIDAGDEADGTLAELDAANGSGSLGDICEDDSDCGEDRPMCFALAPDSIHKHCYRCRDDSDCPADRFCEDFVECGCALPDGDCDPLDPPPDLDMSGALFDADMSEMPDGSHDSGG